MKKSQLIAFIFLSGCYALAGVTIYNYTDSWAVGLAFYMGSYVVFLENFEAKGGDE